MYLMMKKQFDLFWLAILVYTICVQFLIYLFVQALSFWNSWGWSDKQWHRSNADLLLKSRQGLFWTSTPAIETRLFFFFCSVSVNSVDTIHKPVIIKASSEFPSSPAPALDPSRSVKLVNEGPLLLSSYNCSRFSFSLSLKKPDL